MQAKPQTAPLSCSCLLRSTELLYLCLIIPNAIIWWNRGTLAYKRTQETFHRGESEKDGFKLKSLSY